VLGEEAFGVLLAEGPSAARGAAEAAAALENDGAN
jgi:hypothetical protein